MPRTTSTPTERDPMPAQQPTDERAEITADDRGQRSRGVSDPSPSDIAARAYDLYAERGFEDGHDKDDWFEAERELREE
jgi:hypothetical protein